MKIPQTFILEKNLEEKISLLLKETGTKKEEQLLIDLEAEKLFPNFINYLKKEYDFLHIEKTPDKYKQAWAVYNREEPGIFTVIGLIQEYVENEGIMSSYGYKAEILIGKKRLKLFYRTGCQYYDTQGKLVVTKSPARYDMEEIPFP